MEIQLIRNATMKITYAGKTFLTDPMLSPKDEFHPFAGKARNPTVELPLTNDEILEGIESVLVTHTHPDHFDPAAGKTLPKELPVFCQPGDKAQLAEAVSRILPLLRQLTSGKILPSDARVGNMEREKFWKGWELYRVLYSRPMVNQPFIG